MLITKIWTDKTWQWTTKISHREWIREFKIHYMIHLKMTFVTTTRQCQIRVKRLYKIRFKHIISIRSNFLKKVLGRTRMRRSLLRHLTFIQEKANEMRLISKLSSLKVEILETNRTHMPLVSHQLSNLKIQQLVSIVMDSIHPKGL